MPAASVGLKKPPAGGIRKDRNLQHDGVARQARQLLEQIVVGHVEKRPDLILMEMRCEIAERALAPDFVELRRS